MPAPLVEGADPPAADYAPADISALNESPDALYCNGVALAWAAALLASGVLVLYELWFNHRHPTIAGLPQGVVPMFLTTMGIGTILRLASDPQDALLQVRGKLAGDNSLLAGAEMLWMGFSIAGGGSLRAVGISFMLAGASLWLAQPLGISTQRRAAADKAPDSPGDRAGAAGIWRDRHPAQVADFLYAPTDYILIDRLLSPIDIAAYAPAVQIDGGLLLLATALASVVLPRRQRPTRVTTARRCGNTTCGELPRARRY